MRQPSTAVVALALALACVVAAAPGAAPSASRGAVATITVTHGVSVTEVTATTALVWARASGAGRLHVVAARDQDLRQGVRRASALAGPKTDFTALATLRGLRPGTRYHYRVWFSHRRAGYGGVFKTAPSGSRPARVRFVYGGEVAGGRLCRHQRWGLPAFFYMTTVEPDFFVSLGDLIYADEACPRDGPGDWKNVPGNFLEIDDRRLDWEDTDAVREVYRQHWRYLRADRHAQYLFARVPLYATWDDHEVINDFGGTWPNWNAQSGRRGFPNLVTAGRESFFAYTGISARPRDPTRLYRSFRWGRNLHLFLADARSYRSRNDETDRSPKTMLGSRQLAWLKAGLRRSRATWKIVASSVPLSVPTGSTMIGRDAWANGDHHTGFERELLDLLRFLDAQNVRNVVFISADVHFAQTLRYEGDYDGDGDRYRFHELTTGPLNARLQKPYWLDMSFNPTSLYGEGGFFNFGLIDVWRNQGRTFFRAQTRDGSGKVRPGSVLTLSAS